MLSTAGSWVTLMTENCHHLETPTATPLRWAPSLWPDQWYRHSHHSTSDLATTRPPCSRELIVATLSPLRSSFDRTVDDPPRVSEYYRHHIKTPSETCSGRRQICSTPVSFLIWGEFLSSSSAWWAPVTLALRACIVMCVAAAWWSVSSHNKPNEHCDASLHLEFFTFMLF